MTIKMFPIVFGKAITGHGTQGKSLEAIVVRTWFGVSLPWITNTLMRAKNHAKVFIGEKLEMRRFKKKRYGVLYDYLRHTLLEADLKRDMSDTEDPETLHELNLAVEDLKLHLESLMREWLQDVNS